MDACPKTCLAIRFLNPDIKFIFRSSILCKSCSELHVISELLTTRKIKHEMINLINYSGYMIKIK